MGEITLRIVNGNGRRDTRRRSSNVPRYNPPEQKQSEFNISAREYQDLKSDISNLKQADQDLQTNLDNLDTKIAKSGGGFNGTD